MENQLPKEVAEAKEKGAVLLLTGEDDKHYYFKSPNTQDFNRYLATAAKGKVHQAVNNLVMDLAIHPGQQELKTMFRDRPGLMVALNNALQTAIGLNEEFAVKKL